MNPSCSVCLTRLFPNFSKQCNQAYTFNTSSDLEGGTLLSNPNFQSLKTQLRQRGFSAMGYDYLVSTYKWWTKNQVYFRLTNDEKQLFCQKCGPLLNGTFELTEYIDAFLPKEYQCEPSAIYEDGLDPSGIQLIDFSAIQDQAPQPEQVIQQRPRAGTMYSAVSSISSGTTHYVREGLGEGYVTSVITVDAEKLWGQIDAFKGDREIINYNYFLYHKCFTQPLVFVIFQHLSNSMKELFQAQNYAGKPYAETLQDYATKTKRPQASLSQNIIENAKKYLAEIIAIAKKKKVKLEQYAASLLKINTTTNTEILDLLKRADSSLEYADMVKDLTTSRSYQDSNFDIRHLWGEIQKPGFISTLNNDALKKNESPALYFLKRFSPELKKLFSVAESEQSTLNQLILKLIKPKASGEKTYSAKQALTLTYQAIFESTNNVIIMLECHAIEEGKKLDQIFPEIKSLPGLSPGSIKNVLSDSNTLSLETLVPVNYVYNKVSELGTSFDTQLRIAAKNNSVPPFLQALLYLSGELRILQDEAKQRGIGLRSWITQKSGLRQNPMPIYKKVKADAEKILDELTVLLHRQDGIELSSQSTILPLVKNLKLSSIEDLINIADPGLANRCLYPYRAKTMVRIELLVVVFIFITLISYYAPVIFGYFHDRFSKKQTIQPTHQYPITSTHRVPTESTGKHLTPSTPHSSSASSSTKPFTSSTQHSSSASSSTKPFTSSIQHSSSASSSTKPFTSSTHHSSSASSSTKPFTSSTQHSSSASSSTKPFTSSTQHSSSASSSTKPFTSSTHHSSSASSSTKPFTSSTQHSSSTSSSIKHLTSSASTSSPIPKECVVPQGNTFEDWCSATATTLIIGTLKEAMALGYPTLGVLSNHCHNANLVLPLLTLCYPGNAQLQNLLTNPRASISSLINFLSADQAWADLPGRVIAKMGELAIQRF